MVVPFGNIRSFVGSPSQKPKRKISCLLKLEDANESFYALVWWPVVLGLTAEALDGELVSGAVSVDHHHAGTVVPLKFESCRAADQVHVARVIYLKAKLLESRLGISQVDIELRGKMKKICMSTSRS